MKTLQQNDYTIIVYEAPHTRSERVDTKLVRGPTCELDIATETVTLPLDGKSENLPHPE